MVNGKSWRIWAFITGLALTIALFFLAWSYPKFPGDEGVLLAFQALQSGTLDRAARALDMLGDAIPVLVLVAGLAVGVLAARRRADILMIGMGAVLTLGGQALKPLVARARPEYMLPGADSTGFGFPSGHAVYAFIFGGILIFLAGNLIGHRLVRRFVQMGLGIWIVSMGACRVYLGVHWPSDVIGGFMFGAIALTVILTLRNTVNARW